MRHRDNVERLGFRKRGRSSGASEQDLVVRGGGGERERRGPACGCGGRSVYARTIIPGIYNTSEIVYTCVYLLASFGSVGHTVDTVLKLGVCMFESFTIWRLDRFTKRMCTL